MRLQGEDAARIPSRRLLVHDGGLKSASRSICHAWFDFDRSAFFGENAERCRERSLIGVLEFNVGR